MTIFDLPAVTALVQAAIAEDVGRGDLTTRVTIPGEAPAQAEILARQDGVIAGLPLVSKVFEALGSAGVAVEPRLMDGTAFAAGTVVTALAGPAADLLTGERVVLNFLQHLSGIATLTRRFVQAVAGTRARIVDTRKTIPGMRVLEKYAVRMGRGHNHRMGLDDGVLIKDNHLVAAGGVAAAVERARQGAPHTVSVEVECTTLAQVQEALAAGADAILLDNMSREQIAAAVREVAGAVLVEASGGVTLATVREVAETGVDLISVGALTHSASVVDLSMQIRLCD